LAQAIELFVVPKSMPMVPSPECEAGYIQDLSKGKWGPDMVIEGAKCLKLRNLAERKEILWLPFPASSDKSYTSVIVLCVY
jgi:hypothetical protein